MRRAEIAALPIIYQEWIKIKRMENITYSIFLIFTGAAIFATLALAVRQAMIVGYIILGVVLGTSGLGLVDDATLIFDISHIGIIFLLYLLGLDLLPQQLMRMLGKALVVTLISSASFAILGYVVGVVFGYNTTIESLLIASVMMFSSTIVGLKLLPTTILHHKHTGQIIISILLIQDLLAIIVLLLLQGYGKGGNIVTDILFEMIVLLLVYRWRLSCATLHLNQTDRAL